MSKEGAILTNAKEFVKKLDAWRVNFHVALMKSFTVHLDNIRNSAVDNFMEPNRYKSITRIYTKKNGDLSIYPTKIFRKLQPPVAGKLTVRTGKLSSILKSPGTWNIPRTKAEARLRADPHLMFWVRPQTTSGGMTYEMRLSVTEKGDKFLRYRTNWENNGRPFMRPAIDRENIQTLEPTVWKQLRPVVDRTL